MNFKWIRISILLITTLLIVGCGDSHNLDKTVRNSSILRGENVSETSPAFHRTVLLVQHLEINGDTPALFGVCSGLVLNSRTILTAAHCLENGTEGMKVIIKPNPRLGLDEIHDVYSVIDSRQHPGFVSKLVKPNQSIEEIKANADLALVLIDRSLPGTLDANEDLEFYSSAQTGSTEDNSSIKILITGFGRTTALKDTTGLSFGQINGLSSEAWVLASSNDFNSSHFSLNQKNSVGVCYGDSGGPAFIKKNNNYQAVAIAVGVFQEKTSGLKLNQRSEKESVCSGFGLYLNIEFYKSWINETRNELKKSNI